MFPLTGNAVPSTAAELEAELTRSLGAFVSGSSGKLVTVRGDGPPEIAELTIVLDGATVHPPPVASLQRAPSVTAPAFRVGRLAISGRSVRLHGSSIDFTLAGRDVQFNQSSDRGSVTLLVHDAAEGHIAAVISLGELEKLIGGVARTEAAKQGVTVDEAKLHLLARGARSLDAEVRVRARKLFLSAVIRLTASLDIDEALNLRLTRLGCHGNGALGTLACGVIAPHLQKLDGREIALMALPLGEVRLHDVHLEVGAELQVTAHFGSGTERRLA